MTTLYVQDGAGFRQADSHDVIREAQTILSRRFRVGTPALATPEKMGQFLQLHLAPREYEVFGAVYLDSRYRVIRHEDLFRGTLDCAPVHVREVVVAALRLSAAAIVVYHSVAGHRMRVMCPVSICGLRRLEAITTSILLSGGPHNGRLQRRRRVHARQGRMVIAGPGRSDAAGAGGSLRGCLASSVATDRRSKVLSGLSWRVRRSSTPPASCAS